MNKPINKNQSGVGLIEILVVVSIISITLASLAGVGNFALKIQHRTKQNTIAAFLAVESIEAARAIKDGQWGTLTSFSANTPLHPIKNPSLFQWTLADGEESINGFQRQLRISNVYRDSAFNITTSGGALDDNTKKITSIVAWSDNGQSQQITITDYLTDWKP